MSCQGACQLFPATFVNLVKKQHWHPSKVSFECPPKVEGLIRVSMGKQSSVVSTGMKWEGSDGGEVIKSLKQWERTPLLQVSHQSLCRSVGDHTPAPTRDVSSTTGNTNSGTPPLPPPPLTLTSWPMPLASFKRPALLWIYWRFPNVVMITQTPGDVFACDNVPGQWAQNNNI